MGHVGLRGGKGQTHMVTIVWPYFAPTGVDYFAVSTGRRLEAFELSDFHGSGARSADQRSTDRRCRPATKVRELLLLLLLPLQLLLLLSTLTERQKNFHILQQRWRL